MASDSGDLGSKPRPALEGGGTDKNHSSNTPLTLKALLGSICPFQLGGTYFNNITREASKILPKRSGTSNLKVSVHRKGGYLHIDAARLLTGRSSSARFFAR